MNVIIILGTSNNDELKLRVETAIKDSFLKNCYYIISGTNEECDKMKKILKEEKINNILEDNKSKNTIENIINSLSIVSTLQYKNLSKEISFEEPFGIEEVIDYINKIIIISSDYHIERIKLITKEISKKIMIKLVHNIEFNSVDTKSLDRKFIIKRVANEILIKKHKKEYMNQIKKYYFEN